MQSWHFFYVIQTVINTLSSSWLEVYSYMDGPNKIEFILESTNLSCKNCIIELPQISKLYKFYRCLNIKYTHVANIRVPQSISSNVAADMIWTSVWGKPPVLLSYIICHKKKDYRDYCWCTLNSKKGTPWSLCVSWWLQTFEAEVILMRGCQQVSQDWQVVKHNLIL